MTSTDLKTLLRMQQARYSHPLRHLWAALNNGNPERLRQRIGGALGHDEGAMLYTLANELPPFSTIVEIGTLKGRSTAYLGLGAKPNRSRVYGIDPFDSE